MADTLDEAIKKLHEAATKLGSASEAMERMVRDSIPPRGGGSGGRKGGKKKDDEPDPEPPEPGVFGKLFGGSRYGRAFSGAEGRFRELFGKSGTDPKTGEKYEGLMGGRMAMLGKAIGVGAVVLEAGKALIEFKRSVEQATTAQLESYRKLGELNGQIGVIMATRDMRDMVRDMKRANQIAGSAGALADSEARRKDAFLPLETLAERAVNNLLAGINNAMADGMKPVNELVEVLKVAFNIKDPKPGPSGLEWAITRPGGILDEAAEAEKRGRDLIAAVKLADGRIGGRAVIAPGGAAPKGALP